MKQKNIKVAYTSRSTGNSYTQVPKIQMEGKWLEELGFSIGSTIVVEYDNNSIRIRPMTAEEAAERKRAETRDALFNSDIKPGIDYSCNQKAACFIKFCTD